MNTAVVRGQISRVWQAVSHPSKFVLVALLWWGISTAMLGALLYSLGTDDLYERLPADPTFTIIVTMGAVGLAGYLLALPVAIIHACERYAKQHPGVSDWAWGTVALALSVASVLVLAVAQGRAFSTNDARLAGLLHAVPASIVIGFTLMQLFWRRLQTIPA